MNVVGVVMLSLMSIGVYDTEPTAVDAYLGRQLAAHPTFIERFAAIAHDGLGTTYADGPLGEGPTGDYDKDPLIDLSRVDCVTYIEQCAALAQSKDFSEASAVLQQIRYANGHIGYESRNHFMLADWIPNNRWCSDITPRLGVKTAHVTRTISMRDFFKRVKAPDVGQDIADRAVTIEYIPTALAVEAELAFTTPTLVVFVGKIDWLFALHCGVYLPDGMGGGKLYHASSQAGEVAAMDFSDYVLSQSKRYLGFTAYEITAPEFGVGTR